ncbi:MULTISPECIES: 4'-phosphopantetheinyl transferase family protein [unclassified Pseudomonas]|uniref:4'-phosphopantetheinyl transferase family protein n=1 Tax=unclassified Pseudomonas TaxID=196821 RepID=UPI0008CEE85B|nr:MULTISPECIES: 4'-phosphopantetheinyl transferase superfamily protein [unclassified Pseudomonas]PMV21789.1 4'-phosphopantetheinyl transferase [Pseudomonas sp. FW305-3-2-15-C-TSA2]PMV28323.1 4'-phosphopantetheinyl transferase [Pseudomonas sp. DP16D-L5]PMV38720.1 4'-phosphopantetheinyl transferase [Pseudomonas sp. FW305-3-2-15-A-LB2]PMV43996.1 4'-phosphopantetheinyl transferase [Pseudomonas sp. FW305-3-2-15-C-R2A1]PMV51089.1 4'-phosphopantetheinyl transferase [Pseudomonas sp. FW305-3-2-15-C-LB
MNPLPACCTPLDAHWPLPEPLPGTVFLSTRFDPALLTAGDFQRCAVPPPASIQRSVAKRQAEFLAGRLCARAALQQLDHLDCIPAIGEDRAPVWPAPISGSITHSTGHAAAIVGHKAQWRGLGMDLENVLSLERAERLAGEILTADELLRMAALPRERIALLVTLTFSAKESLFKALYPIVQKRFYFEHAELLEWSEGGHLRLRLLTDLSEEWCHGKELVGQFAVDDGQLLSLVAVSA